jgi:hypothetical protein
MSFKLRVLSNIPGLNGHHLAQRRYIGAVVVSYGSHERKKEKQKQHR